MDIARIIGRHILRIRFKIDIRFYVNKRMKIRNKNEHTLASTQKKTSRLQRRISRGIHRETQPIRLFLQHSINKAVLYIHVHVYSSNINYPFFAYLFPGNITRKTEAQYVKRRNGERWSIRDMSEVIP